MSDITQQPSRSLPARPRDLDRWPALRRPIISLLVVVVGGFASFSGLWAADRSALPEVQPLPATSPWPPADEVAAPAVEWIRREKPVQSLWLDGPPFRGQPTRVFAYYASPKTLYPEVSPPGPFPGMVLLHGGGGHAFREWVELYAKQGYAAIAIDMGGRWEENGQFVRHEWAGPDQDDETKFQRAELPDEDQWTYHSVYNALAAHSWLRAQPDVEASRTGLTGISWGGYLTCIVAAVDPRYKAACPVYGCGHLADGSYWLHEFARMTPEWRARWNLLWDPASYVSSIRMPVLFTNGTKDFAYWCESYQETYAQVASRKLIRVEPDMPHGHIFEIGDVLRFFAAELGDGPRLPQVSSLLLQPDSLAATIDSPFAVTSVELWWTTGPRAQGAQRDWQSRPLTVNVGASPESYDVTGVRAPADAAVWMIVARDQRGALCSSELQCSSEQPRGGQPSR